MALSFLIGIIASGISFFLTVRLGRPRIVLSKNIVHQKLYRAKILNKTCARSVYDISIYVHYKFADGTFFLAPRKYIPVLTRMPRESIGSTPKEIGPYEMYIHIGDIEMKDKDTIPLCDFFEKQPGKKSPYIDIVVICYSKLGGGIRYVTTRRYFKDDIKEKCQFMERSTEVMQIEDDENTGIK